MDKEIFMVGDKMNFNNIRSDLAGEFIEQLESGKHYNKEEYVTDGIKVEKINNFKRTSKYQSRYWYICLK